MATMVKYGVARGLAPEGMPEVDSILKPPQKQYWRFLPTYFRQQFYYPFNLQCFQYFNNSSGMQGQTQDLKAKLRFTMNPQTLH